MAALFRDRPDLAPQRRGARRAPASSRSTTSATASPTTRCRRARRCSRSCCQADRRRARATATGPYHEKARRQIERELALIGKLEPRRLLPHRLGHRELLPRARDPRPGPRLRRQQRGLLQPRHHRRRSRGHGAAVRALPLRGAAGVAGHRPRPAQRRPARGGHPARLPQVRRARRGHDRQRHHLPRAQRGPRDRQGAGASREPEIDRLAAHAAPLRVRRPRRQRCERRLARGAASTGATARVQLFARLFGEIQDLPRHLGQHSGGMVIAQGRARRRGAAGARHHARPRGRAVGQGRLRRPAAS